MLLNKQGLVFVGRRNDIEESEAWQMPQGGINPGEQPQQAALRELAEETGIKEVDIISQSSQWLYYEYPAKIHKKSFAQFYRGQQQRWFAMRFLGDEKDIDLNASHAEFDSWQWTKIERLTAMIVNFKRPVYEAVVREFRHLAFPVSNPETL